MQDILLANGNRRGVFLLRDQNDRFFRDREYAPFLWNVQMTAVCDIECFSQTCSETKQHAVSDLPRSLYAIMIFLQPAGLCHPSDAIRGHGFNRGCVLQHGAVCPHALLKGGGNHLPDKIFCCDQVHTREVVEHQEMVPSMHGSYLPYNHRPDIIQRFDPVCDFLCHKECSVELSLICTGQSFILRDNALCQLGIQEQDT